MLENRIAISLVLLTFALLIIGGNVNATGSSLACAEPTLICNGQILPAMTGGVLYEHGHRLVAMLVGFAQIGLTVLLWRRRRELRLVAVAALAAVCVQGLLGALTVGLKLVPAVSTAHLLLGMSYLALLFYIVLRTRRPDQVALVRRDHSLTPWIRVGAALVFAQILLGGLQRHLGGAVSCLDFPLCHGSLWPTGAPLALKLHMAHRILGMTVGLYVVGLGLSIWRTSREWPALRRLALVSSLLVAWQITFGALTILTMRSVIIADLHFAGAVGLWLTFVTMVLSTRTSLNARDVATWATPSRA